MANTYQRDDVSKSVTEANNLFMQLKGEVDDGWKTSWKELSEYINPTRGHFDGQPNRGNMIDHQKVLDGYATLACETLAAGLLSGMTSPARPWFKLAVDDFLMDAIPDIRAWLDEVEKGILRVLGQSNIYQSLYGIYKELGTFATGCMAVLSDPISVVRAHSFTAGEYALGLDGTGRVGTFSREYWMSVNQLVNTFGLENCSNQVQADWNQNKRNNWYPVKHLIAKNRNQVEGAIGNAGMGYHSLYWDAGHSSNKFLGQRGFKLFPILAPRWETVTTHQVYGKGPGWHSLGDIKQLQKTADDKLKLQEKLHNPPVTADSDIEGNPNLIPGGVTKTSPNTPEGGVRPAYTVPDALSSFIEMENHLKENIDKFYFVNLFHMLMNMDKTNMTATEIAERQQEKIMMMGPILHRLQEELLDPLINLVFNIMYEQRMLPPPPLELEGADLKIRYISILAQAQEAIGVQQINRVLATILPISERAPSILDNFDMDELAKQVNEMEGAPAKIIRDPEEVAEMREQRQQIEGAQEMAEIGKVGADAGKALAEANKIQQEAQ